MEWTNDEVLFLTENYPDRGKMWVSKKLNKTPGSIRSKCYKLKLKLNHNGEFFKEFQERAGKSKIGKKRPDHSKFMKYSIANGIIKSNLNIPKTDQEKREYGKKVSLRIMKNGHPRGMEGKKHTEETKLKIGEKAHMMWCDENSIVRSDKFKEYQSIRMSKLQNKLNSEGRNTKLYSNAKRGWRVIGGRRVFFRSSWEANAARYFELKKIKWEFEKKTFWFENIKRGVRSYLPDFYLPDRDLYVEVKGYMDAKSKTKLKRMKKYYPDVKIIIWDKEIFSKMILKGIARKIKDWEY